MRLRVWFLLVLGGPSYCSRYYTLALMLFLGCRGSNKLTHRLIVWNQILWLINQVFGAYYQPSVVLSGVILGLVKGSHL